MPKIGKTNDKSKSRLVVTGAEYGGAAIGGSAAPSEETETTAWVAAVVGDGGTVSAGRQTLVNDLIVDLKTAGIWTKLDRLWLFAAENSQSALRDLKAASAATNVSATTFTADAGYTGDASADHIDSNFNPSTAGGHYSLDSACVFAWALLANPNGQGPLGQTGSFSLQLLSDFGGSDDRVCINSTNVLDVPHGGTRNGFLSGNRSASNALQLYKNGASVGSNTAASAAIANSNICFLRINSLFDNGQCGVGGFGSSLDSTEQGALYDALLIYMQAVGAVP